jgi:hypothetical protein
MNDKTVRAATAAAIGAVADDIEKAGSLFEAGATALAKSAKRAAVIIPDVQGLANFGANVMTEVPPSIITTAAMLRGRAAEVLSGAAPAAMPQPELVPAKPVPVVKPATRQLFALRAISWTEGDQLRIGRKFTDVELPVAHADRAITARVCVEMNDPARNRQTLNAWPGHPDPRQCFNLDADVGPVAATAPQHEVIRHSGFVETIGQPRQMRIVTGGAS